MTNLLIEETRTTAFIDEDTLADEAATNDRSDYFVSDADEFDLEEPEPEAPRDGGNDDKKTADYEDENTR